MEIYVSSARQMSRLRWALRESVIEAWSAIPTASIRVPFWSYPERWINSEREAYGKIYCIADDDCLPTPKLDLVRVHDLFDSHPDYGVMAMTNINCVHLHPPESLADKDGVVECHAVGGIRFIRKGTVTEFPADFDGDDMKYWRLMSAQKMKSGYISWAPLLHMGLWSSIWQTTGSR